jgi:hypothetical protein
MNNVYAILLSKIPHYSTVYILEIENHKAIFIDSVSIKIIIEIINHDFQEVLSGKLWH